MAEKTLMDNIQELYPKITKKNEFFKYVADAFGMKPSTIKINWFTGLSIPEDKQPKLIELMQRKIALQNQKSA